MSLPSLNKVIYLFIYLHGIDLYTGKYGRLGLAYHFCLLMEYSYEDTLWPLLPVFHIESDI